MKANALTKLFGCGFILTFATALVAAGVFAIQRHPVSALGIAGIAGTIAIACLLLYLIALLVGYNNSRQVAAQPTAPRPGSMPYAPVCHICRASNPRYVCNSHAFPLCAECQTKHGCKSYYDHSTKTHIQRPESGNAL